MSEAPAEVWLRKSRAGRYYETHYDDEPEIVRYVRADLYEARQARVAESELDAVTRTKADPNRSRREDQLVAEIERLETLVSGLQARANQEPLGELGKAS